MPEYERITAAEVKVGDRIAHARTHTFHTVVDISPGPTSDYITLSDGRRIRPRHSTRLWRELAVDWPREAVQT